VYSRHPSGGIPPFCAILVSCAPILIWLMSAGVVMKYSLNCCVDQLFNLTALLALLKLTNESLSVLDQYSKLARCGQAQHRFECLDLQL
jgi:hypothetical protein